MAVKQKIKLRNKI